MKHTFKKGSKTIIKTVTNIFFYRKDTYCHLLWDGVFIDHKGYVHSCSHSKPGAFGNVYKNNLSYIWTNSTRLKIIRWMSKNKCLYCFFGCKILASEEKKRNIRQYSTKKYPQNVRILYGELCNLSCIMCWQDHKSRVVLDSDILKKNIQWDQVDEIQLQGGEVLAMKNAKALYLWLTTQMNKKVDLITNGMLVTDEWAEYLVKGSNWIQVSVNAATKGTHESVNRKSNFSKVVQNIKKLVHFKNNLNSPVKIIYKYTIIPENIHEIGDAIKFADSLGCDEIVYGYDSSVQSLLNRNSKLREQVKRKIACFVNADLKITIENNKLEQLGILKSN